MVFSHLYFQLSKIYFLAAQRLQESRTDSTPETDIIPNDDCLHVRALAEKGLFSRSVRTGIEHLVTRKSAIQA
jgi:hypothetical protein